MIGLVKQPVSYLPTVIQCTCEMGCWKIKTKLYFNSSLCTPGSVRVVGEFQDTGSREGICKKVALLSKRMHFWYIWQAYSTGTGITKKSLQM